MSKAINGEQAAELYIQGKFIQLLNIAESGAELTTDWEVGCD